MSKKCLIVDDVDVSRYVIHEIMEEYGFTSVEAADEKSMLSALRQEKFDVIIMDWHLRKKQSLSMITDIRQIPSAAHTPIILCTGVEMDKELHHVQDMQIQGFLKKPTSPEKVRSELQRLTLL